MFGGNFWGAPIGNDDHLSQEREPPQRPTRLEFPEYVPPFEPQPLTNHSSSQLRHKICHAKSFLDVSDIDIGLLNLKFERDGSFNSILPDDSFVNRPLLYDDDLQAMLDEISVNNDDAFREVLRIPPLPGRKKPKLAYARNFFGSVEDMARYFDDSKDDYYRVPTTSNKTTESTKTDDQSDSHKQDVEMTGVSTNKPADTSNTKEVYKGYRIASAESMSPGTRISMLKNLLKMTMHRFQCRDHEPIPQPREKFTIRGVKIQSIQYHFCVARIPQEVRMARSRHVEGPIMAVTTREELRFKERNGLENPDKIPFVGERFDLFREVGCLLILAAQRARQSETAAVANEERWWETKQRWGGGPIKWGQLASEAFEDEDPSWSPEEKKLQEEKQRRQSEDQTTTLDPNKLNVTDLLAGGATSHSMRATALPGIPAGTTTIKAGTSVHLDMRPKKKIRSMERPPGTDAAMKQGRRLMYVPPFKQRWYQEWQKLRPNTPMIDTKIISKKIGSEKDEFDEVYMLTGVNHHVAVVRMKVHPDYLAWLESGRKVSGEEVNGLRRDILYVSRTKWFDVFDVEARKEFLIGLWRVFCWINRDYIPEEEYEKVKAKTAASQI